MTDAWRVVALCILATGCPAREDVDCTDDSSCDATAGGACVANTATGNRWCSYPDHDCPSGSRWSDLDVGDGVAGTCVPATMIDPYAGGYAFVSRRDRDAEIYVMAADGSQPRNLTGDRGDDTAPRWSPDGSRIAFLSSRTGVSELFVMGADGGSVTRLTGGVADEPAWSPDGSTIVFTSVRAGVRELYSVPVDAHADPTRLTFGGGATPAWSPDGTYVAFEREGLIITAHRDGSNLHVIATGPDYDPSWSPDGARVAYSHHASLATGNIRVIAVAGGAPIDVTPISSSFDDHPVWSPDGDRVAFIRGDSADYVVASVYVANVDGPGIEPLTDVGRLQRPAWTLDGAGVVFASEVSSDLEIVRVTAMGGPAANLTNQLGDDTDATPRPQ